MMTPTSNVGQQFLGKILLSDGFHVYSVGFRSLFSFILLTYNFVIMLCIDMVYTKHRVDRSFLFCYHPKK